MVKVHTWYLEEKQYPDTSNKLREVAGLTDAGEFVLDKPKLKWLMVVLGKALHVWTWESSTHVLFLNSKPSRLMNRSRKGEGAQEKTDIKLNKETQVEPQIILTAVEHGKESEKMTSRKEQWERSGLGWKRSKAQCGTCSV